MLHGAFLHSNLYMMYDGQVAMYPQANMMFGRQAIDAYIFINVGSV